MIDNHLEADYEERTALDTAHEPTPEDVDGSATDDAYDYDGPEDDGPLPYDEGEPQPYDGGGWPGDGSGTDDLADLMAHGDEGCCDGPGDY